MNSSVPNQEHEIVSQFDEKRYLEMAGYIAKTVCILDDSGEHPIRTIVMVKAPGEK